jgi:hypothetical protein
VHSWLQKVVLKVKMCCMKCVEMVTEVINEAAGEFHPLVFFPSTCFSRPMFCWKLGASLGLGNCFEQRCVKLFRGRAWITNWKWCLHRRCCGCSSRHSGS